MRVLYETHVRACLLHVNLRNTDSKDSTPWNKYSIGLAGAF